MDTKFRIQYKHRQWVGKPDPSGFGNSYLCSDSYSWLQEQMMKLTSKGNKIMRVQRNDGKGNWKTI